MKAFTCQLLLAIALMGLPFTSLQGKARQEQVKKETFVFKSVKKNSLLRLDKDLGNLTIVFWDKDEIRLDRVQTVAAQTDEIARGTIECRVVKQEEGNGVYALKMECSDRSRANYKVEDVWTVYVPENKLSFNVHNEFGDVIFPNGLKCAALDADVAFGTIFIRDVQVREHCALTVQHGALNVEKANMLMVRTKHSDVKIGQVDDLNFSHQFGKVHIGSLKTGVGTTQFTNFTLLALERRLAFNSSKHDTADIGVGDSRSFEGLSVNAEYTTVNLKLDKNLNARYDLQAKFGDVNIQADMHSQHRQKGDTENAFVSMDTGYVGSSANAKAKIDVSTAYSDITMKYK